MFSQGGGRGLEPAGSAPRASILVCGKLHSGGSMCFHASELRLEIVLCRATYSAMVYATYSAMVYA